MISFQLNYFLRPYLQAQSHSVVLILRSRNSTHELSGDTIQPTIHAAAAAAKLLQSCPTLRPHRWQPTRLPHPWDSPGKNTGVGCHFLLQCMKLKSESEVAQQYPTPSDPMDCGPPGSSVHGIFQERVLEWGAIAFSATIYGCIYLIIKGEKSQNIQPSF